ncbi:cyclic diguanosine monophosphate-binding protein [Streptosporangium jomthongense]|uniref:Cyclic diguanosine monophosphate-binding protein n=1 Tax=Marinobacter aromaticivorans TaxID=1494078 RepID=A0ABW2IYK1_9GAMM|nr:PilZ domain-containing protein [Marinobacter aromaticivorans]GGE74296.1 cyclic diguanosine monophosphate-binding protein [Streptosporangium jomthongense]
MPAKASEKRKFHRISFDAPCELHALDRVWETEVLDISLKGVLVKRPDGWDVPLSQPCEVIVHLDEQRAGIVMAVELKHVEDQRLGFRCQYIDLESATHLKRLVELNLGDPVLLEREFAHLIGR